MSEEVINNTENTGDAGNTVEYYLAKLKTPKRKPLVVRQLTDYINAVCAIDTLYKTVYFRGQRDMSWEIVSSAYRPDALKLNPTPNELHNYHKKLMNEVDHIREIDAYKNFSLLAHLQHNGAKTLLIDYTKNPLVALWFACQRKNDEEKDANKATDAAVYCVRESNKLVYISEADEISRVYEGDPAELYIFDPPHINKRITSQQSVLIMNAYGKLDKESHIIIHIPKEHRQTMLEQLNLTGISRKTLFPDFQGLVEWFRVDEREEYGDLIRSAADNLKRYKLDDAISDYTNALKLIVDTGLFTEPDIETANIRMGLGEAYHESGQFSKALKEFQTAKDIYEQELGLEHPDTAMSYNDMGIVYCRQGDYAAALAWYEKALTIREKVLGLEHPDTAGSYNNIGSVYHEQGEYAKALEWYAKALTIFEKVLGLEHPDTATSYNNVGAAYANQGDYPEALEWHEKALKIREKKLGSEHPRTQNTLNNIAIVKQASKRKSRNSKEPPSED